MTHTYRATITKETVFKLQDLPHAINYGVVYEFEGSFKDVSSKIDIAVRPLHLWTSKNGPYYRFSRSNEPKEGINYIEHFELKLEKVSI